MSKVTTNALMSVDTHARSIPIATSHKLPATPIE
jgi:hypothetical protein